MNPIFTTHRFKRLDLDANLQRYALQARAAIIDRAEDVGIYSSMRGAYVKVATGDIVAIATWLPMRDNCSAWVYTVYVSPVWRGKNMGVSVALWEALMEDIRSVPTVELIEFATASSNLRAQGFYDKMIEPSTCEKVGAIYYAFPVPALKKDVEHEE